MLKEIHEQPLALRRTLDQTRDEAERIAEKNARKIKMIYFTGSGTSYHACMAANYVVSRVTRLSVKHNPCVRVFSVDGHD